MKKIFTFLSLTFGLLWSNAQFTEGFEGGAIPSGWTVINQGDPNGWEVVSNYTTTSLPRTGSGMLGIVYHASQAHDDYVITPPINVVAGVSDKLVFYGWNHGLSFLEQFDIKISTTTPTISAFTNNLAVGVKPPSRVWTQYTYDLSAYVGQTIYIAFYINTTNEYFLGIDDFEITGNALGLVETRDAAKLAIYPNPVTDYAVLVPAQGQRVEQIQLFDAMGRLVKTERYKGYEQEYRIDVTNLKAGIYTLTYFQDGKANSTKLIKCPVLK